MPKLDVSHRFQGGAWEIYECDHCPRSSAGPTFTVYAYPVNAGWQMTDKGAAAGHISNKNQILCTWCNSYHEDGGTNIKENDPAYWTSVHPNDRVVRKASSWGQSSKRRAHSDGHQSPSPSVSDSPTHSLSPAGSQRPTPRTSAHARPPAPPGLQEATAAQISTSTTQVKAHMDRGVAEITTLIDLLNTKIDSKFHGYMSMTAGAPTINTNLSNSQMTMLTSTLTAHIDNKAQELVNHVTNTCNQLTVEHGHLQDSITELSKKVAQIAADRYDLSHSSQSDPHSSTDGHMVPNPSDEVIMPVDPADNNDGKKDVSLDDSVSDMSLCNSATKNDQDDEQTKNDQDGEQKTN